MTNTRFAWYRRGLGGRVRRLRAALAMACAAALALSASSANAAGGYTYKLVRLFDSTTSPETLAEYVLNDKGQVAYLTTAASTASGGGTIYTIHLWDPKATVVDSVVYTAQFLSCSASAIGCSGTSNPVPILRGNLGYSGSLALSNNGVVSVAAYFPQAGNVLTYSNTGYINIDLTQQPVLSYTVSVNNYSQGGLFTQGTQLSATGARAVVNVPPGQGIATLGVASPGGLLLSSTQVSVGWNASTPGGGGARPVPAINSAGLVSVVNGPSASIVDLPAGSSSAITTPFGDSTWVTDGHLALNTRGEAAIMTAAPFRAALMPAVRTASPRVLADVSVFPNSAPVFAISLSDRDELTFQTIDGNTWPGIWSIAADGAPVEVFSSLDPTFVVRDAVSGAVIQDLSPCNGGASCVGNHASWFQSGDYEPYDNIIANNQGAVAFYMVSGSVGPLVVAVPTPGLRPSAPVMPTMQDSTTHLMTFSGPCASLYGGSGFLTPTLATPAGAFAGTCYVDPAPATGFTLTSAAGADLFQSVVVPAPLPGGQSSFTVNYQQSGAPISTPLIAGQVLTFPAGGVAAFTITGINAAENLSPADPTAFVVGLTWVGKGAQPTDFTMQPQADTGPTITPTVSGTQGSNGWYTSNVTVSWNVTDPFGTITNQTGCSAIQIGSDTTGQTVTCTATSAGGTNSQSVTIKRDATPPIALATASPLPNGNGWNDTAVSVSFSGSDATSGIAACSPPVSVSTQGAGQTSPAGTCTDNAGNVSAPVSASNINIEFSGPTVSDMVSASPNANGWYNGPVTFSFAATDALSGVTTNACSSPITLSANGSNESASATCTNRAGDSTTFTVSGVNIDTVPPAATAIAVPPPNANGWNNTAVTVSFAGTDSINGSGVASCSANVTLASEGTGQLAAGTCNDLAGNTSTAATDTVNIDLTAPAVQIVTPQTGSGFPQGFSIAANYTCSDALSGIAAAGCVAPIANGAAISTSTTGTQQFTVTATDQAGNGTTTSSSYLVSTLNYSSPGSIWTYAGNGVSGFSGDGGPAVSAELVTPYGVATDAAGNLYIADVSGQRIRKVTPGGIISTVAGNGIETSGGDGGPATSAGLNNPFSVAVDGADNIYIADSGNDRIRKVATDGSISTVAGGGSSGLGDGGPATAAILAQPFGITVDAGGNLFIADTGQNRIRKVTPDGTISTVAGTGVQGFGGDGGPATAALLALPNRVAVDSAGNLFIDDLNNDRIRKVTADGTITTVAGTGDYGYTGDGGPSESATLAYPHGITVDAAGNLYVADSGNNVIRRVSVSDGTISTLVGSTAGGFSGDGGSANAAELAGPQDAAFDSQGNLYIADYLNRRIRLVPGAGVTDNAPPAITPTINGTTGSNGWYTSNVTVAWTVSDPLAPIISQTGCSTTTISADTVGQVITCTAVGQGGTSTKSVTIKRDATPPMALATPAPLPNGNGWNNTTVAVTFTGTDSTSGIATCSAPTALATQGANQTSSAGTCTDNAGNVSAPVSAGNINIDETPPVVSGSASPPANANGWRHTSVNVTFTATDSLSGVTANACGAPVLLVTNGAGQSVVGSCADRAGNVATASVSGISIDTIAPSVVATATPPANPAGWNNSTVTVAFSGTDNLSGSGIASCSPSTVVSTPGSGLLAFGICTDRAGNAGGPVSYLVNLDETPPTVAIATPANSASYALGGVVNAAYSCADDLSGVAACAGTVANGSPIDTSSVGTKTFTVNAADVAGNIAASTVSYTVAPASVAFTLTPNALNFGNQAEHSSTALPITLTSTGTGAVPITQIAVSGGNTGQFSQTHTCGATVPAGTSCVITVAFNPTSLGAKTSSLIVKAAGHVAEEGVSLTGTAVAPTFSVTPAAVVFGNQAKGVSSAPLTVTITNTGGIVLPLTKINLGGANAGQFAITPSDQTGQVLCGSTLPAGAACNIDIVFTPTSTGAKIATLKVTAGGGGISQTIDLSGTGIIPTYSLAPATLDFGNQAHATRSAPLPITLTNTGSLALPITLIAATGQFSQTNTCGAYMSPGSACTIEVTFAPISRGSKSGTLRVTAGGGAAAMTAALVGNGT